jgi:hypothetical protein
MTGQFGFLNISLPRFWYCRLTAATVSYQRGVPLSRAMREGTRDLMALDRSQPPSMMASSTGSRHPAGCAPKNAGCTDTHRGGPAGREYNFWVGAFLPARTPKPIVERLNREIVAALKIKEVADKIIALGGDPSPMTPAEFDAFVRKEIAINAEIVKASGYQPQ